MTGVVYADKAGKQQRQKARVVCVAGNSIESPRLLLNSASSMFPDGLANSSGQVGRNYMRHTTGSVYAIFEKPVHMYRGTTMAGIVRGRGQARHRRAASSAATRWRPCRSACRSWRRSSIPGAWGRDFTSALDGYDHMAGMWIVGEDMPQETNRVTLHAEREGQVGHADPRTSTSTTTPTTSPCATTPTGRAARVYEAVGATRTFHDAALSVDPQPRHQPDEREARDGVVNKCGPDATTSRTCSSRTAASSPPAAAENPTLTIVTLAIRQADYIAGFNESRRALKTRSRREGRI